MEFEARNYSMGTVVKRVRFSAPTKAAAVIIATKKLGGLRNAQGQGGQKVAAIGVKPL